MTPGTAACQAPLSKLFPLFNNSFINLSAFLAISSGHVWMWELDYKEGWAPKNWCFWTVVLEKTLGTPLDCKEIQPVHPKGDQSWVFIGRTDVEAETLILWPSDVESWLFGKDPDAGKDWGQEEKGMTENEMVGWHHRLNGHGFGWTPGAGDGQGGLACCDGVAKSQTRLSDCTELNWSVYYMPGLVKFTPGCDAPRTLHHGLSVNWESALESRCLTKGPPRWY